MVEDFPLAGDLVGDGPDLFQFHLFSDAGGHGVGIHEIPRVVGTLVFGGEPIGVLPSLVGHDGGFAEGGLCALHHHW